eukprot:XP_024450076.1 zinc finger MYM-type protein 1 [Populus trichocarpa]
MCDVEVMVEQLECASVYEEPALINEQPPTRIDIAHLIIDPSNHPQIWEYPVNQQDEIRRAYINLGSYQLLMSEYPLTVHVKDTTASTLKKEISFVLSHHNLDVQNIKGQGYDDASNMRGEWNGLQALFINDCPYAYYVHCLAHQLQLALIAAAREISDVHTFFQNLIFIVNILSASCKRNDELRTFQAATIEHLVDIGEIETGKRVNQVGGLQQPGDSRWSSHFKSICSLIKMYGATCSVLENIALDGSTYSQRGDAAFSFKLLMSFDFAFILHIMKNVMGITDVLCQALQQKSQDILNVMHLVTTTKTLIQKLRDDG